MRAIPRLENYTFQKSLIRQTIPAKTDASLGLLPPAAIVGSSLPGFDRTGLTSGVMELVEGAKRQKTGGIQHGSCHLTIQEKLNAIRSVQHEIDKFHLSTHRRNYSMWCAALNRRVWSHQMKKWHAQSIREMWQVWRQPQSIICESAAKSLKMSD